MPTRYWKATKNEKTEIEPTGQFYVDVSGDLVFFYGGGLEGCLPKRLCQKAFDFLKKEGIVK